MKEILNNIGNLAIVTLLISFNISLWWAMAIGYKEHKEKEKLKRMKVRQNRTLRSQYK